MTNQLIIFSKNRACQLHLLLDSIYECSGYLFDSIVVLYKSDDEYDSGYELLKKRLGKHELIKFKKETNFRDDVLKLMKKKTFTTFLVDDVVFFKSFFIPCQDIFRHIIDKDALCFSLRLGLNSTYSHPANMTYEMGEHEIDGKFLTFDFTKQKGDLGYPLSVDGHIFKTEVIKPLIEKTMFHNPNTLEANLQQYMRVGLPSNDMSSFKQSIIVGVPVNIVNDTFKNRNGLEHYISEKNLNDRYLNGEVISYLDLDFCGINGPHKEIEYKFKQYVAGLT